MGIADLRFLSLEVSNKCSLAEEHKAFCPARLSHLRDAPPARDEDLVAFVKVAIKRGFHGEIGYHYYCDPLEDKTRLRKLIHEIDYQCVLWTNGVLLTEEDRSWLGVFSRIVVTLHRPRDRERLERILVPFPQAQICTAAYDDRLAIYNAPATWIGPCIKPDETELPVDYYGDLHLCCGDWKGQVWIGNVREPETSLDAFELAASEALEGKMELCSRCRALARSPACSGQQE